MGLPGAGKTSVGRATAELLGVPFVDIDAEVERKASSSIAELIRVEGEQRFRSLESETLLEALKSTTGVISLGGGAVMRAENRAAVRQHGFTVYLKVQTSTALARVMEDQRRANSAAAGTSPGQQQILRPVLFPSAADGCGSDEATLYESVERRFEVLRREREAAYLEAANLAVWTDFASPRCLASVIVSELNAYHQIVEPADQTESDTIIVPTLEESNSTPGSLLVIRNGGCANVGERIVARNKASKVVIFCDANILASHGECVAQSCERAGLDAALFTIPAGEQSKSFSVYEALTEILAEAQTGKSDTVVAIGGGVVGDVAGFAASTYMRGIRLIQIPTTLVAQVDSAVGGKTAINTVSAKNLVGTFYPATEVMVDAELLTTLPDREYRSGLAEVVKYGAIASRPFLHWLNEHAQAILDRRPDVVREMVEHCLVAKAHVVEHDLLDTAGIRATLNFGHTLGHALESLTGYSQYLHGEAVAWGMAQAIGVSSLVHGTDVDDETLLALLLRKFNLPVEVPPELTAGAKEYLSLSGIAREDEIFTSRDVDGRASEAEKAVADAFAARWGQALMMDKKREHTAVNYVTVNPLGSARVEKLQLDTLLRCFAWVVSQHGNE